jgi:Glutathione S-transferase, N-terminal domain
MRIPNDLCGAPYGRVPTLEEDGFALFESTAILNYLEATRSPIRCLSSIATCFSISAFALCSTFPWVGGAWETQWFRRGG